MCWPSRFVGCRFRANFKSLISRASKRELSTSRVSNWPERSNCNGQHIGGFNIRLGCSIEQTFTRSKSLVANWLHGLVEASFKAAPEGYVFKSPSPWLYARPHYYLVNGA